MWLRNPYYLAAVIIFLVINPRLFSAPKKITNWIIKVVIGEKIYTANLIKKDYISTALCFGMFLLFPLVIYAVWNHLFQLAILTFGLKMSLKFWYLDRMVFLYEESKGDAVCKHCIK